MNKIKKLMITLVALLAVTTGAWAQAPTIYFQQDYSTETVDWTTSTSGRFTPIIEDGYLTVTQDQRNNNGTTLTCTATEGKVDAGKDFTMTFNVKLGASSNQNATAFNIYDASNSGLILSLAEGSVGATAWKINQGTQTATVSAGGSKGLDELSWIFVEVTSIAGGKTYLTLKDEQNNIIDGFDKTEIPTLSVAGGLGKMTFVTSRYLANFAIDNILVRDVVDDASASTVEVAWDKASKTGTFTMPGGNVELEPEYYPQAALTAVPTAINDVPATTDGAIVNAGTVANIDGTTTAQGTVMYYVSTTALDDAALLALAADAWTADVPTAESFTAAGTAHVYYYVRGNDSDNDDENFSDGDIVKAANALTVNIAAAPTYAVTFAEGTDPNEWTADPATDVTKGDKVTVTYSGTKKVLGVKAEKKAAAVSGIVNPVVGQIIGSDGNNYDANATLPTGVTAVAMIAYVGSDNGEAAPYNHGLALALSDANSGNSCKWNTSNTDAGHTKQNSDSFTSESGLQYNDATHNSDDYPAFKAAITYSPAAPTGCSAWFLASGYQWNKMIGATGLGLSNLGLEFALYWSSSEDNAGSAWRFHSSNGNWFNSSKSSGVQVRACLAF